MRPKCYNCGLGGHFYFTCNRSRDFRGKSKCYNCGVEGHFARECKKRREFQFQYEHTNKNETKEMDTESKSYF